MSRPQRLVLLLMLGGAVLIRWAVGQPNTQSESWPDCPNPLVVQREHRWWLYCSSIARSRRHSTPAQLRLLLGLKLDLNRSTSIDFEHLPGIGPAIAARIVRDRQVRGAFRVVEDLARIRGIGWKTVERLRPYVTVE